MAKKTVKKKVSKPRPKPKPQMQTFPPKFSTRGVRITGFNIEIWGSSVPSYEGDDLA